MKLILKVLASRLKSVISIIVNQNQVAYVNNRFISESGRLISDVLEITNGLDIIEGLLMTVDIEKAFDSINHSFLMCLLRKIGFGNDFRKWKQILIKTQNHVINGSKTTPYFKLERGTRQPDPISAYLFILALEVVFSLIKANSDIKCLQFFSHTFLYSADADDTTFFLRNEKSATEVIKTFEKFSLYSGLKSVKLLALQLKRGLRSHSVEWNVLI